MRRSEAADRNVGSQGGLRANNGGAAHYSIAKAGFHHYTRQLAA